MASSSKHPPDAITNVPWFSSIFPRQRFCDILKYLHLANNETTPPKDSSDYKLYKLGNVLDVLSKTFKANYHPGRELAGDEQMVGTRCRVSFVQYMPKKTVKFGIKIWELYDSGTEYCLKFQIYKGKENDTAEKGLTFRVVTDLREGYTNKNHHV